MTISTAAAYGYMVMTKTTTETKGKTKTKTTLNLDHGLLHAAKRRAADEGTTLTHVVEEALRAALVERQPTSGFKLRLPTVRGGGPPRVDVADREALYDLMEGRT